MCKAKGKTIHFDGLDVLCYCLGIKARAISETEDEQAGKCRGDIKTHLPFDSN